ncbi:MAG: phage holin family protein [Gemmatimonadaceae bacterium]|jgi:putative membrane protein|nr:phage holin family protein [Gemmatimonadaceae bacterium]
MRLLLKLVVNAAALWLAAKYVPGISYTGTLVNLLVVALIFGAVNVFIKPILKLLSFPIRLLTLGLFTLVINAGMLWLTGALARDMGFAVSGFQAAFLGALLVSVVSAVLGFLIPDGDD